MSISPALLVEGQLEGNGADPVVGHVVNRRAELLQADTPVVNDSSTPSTMPSAALANLTGPDTPASSRPGPSGVSPVPASKRLRGWESDEDDDEA